MTITVKQVDLEALAREVVEQSEQWGFRNQAEFDNALFKGKDVIKFMLAFEKHLRTRPPITNEQIEAVARAMRREDHKYCCTGEALNDLDALPLSEGLLSTVRAGLAALSTLEVR